MRITTLLFLLVFAAAAFAQTEKPPIPKEVEAMQNLVMDQMHGPVESGDATATAESYPALKDANAAFQAMTLPMLSTWTSSASPSIRPRIETLRLF